ncbi:MAG: phage portal protein [Oscillospiraceae bacterium]|nr:phage portal protein [Oscillospiraceae bacterium]
MASIRQRLQHAWNAFRNNRDPTDDIGAVYKNPDPVTVGYASSTRPDRLRLTRGKERSIVTAIYNRIAVDTAAVKIQHVRTNENGRYKETIRSGLNECLTLDANTDQTGRQLIQDAVMSMFDEGCVALVPVDTDINPTQTGGYDILSIRTAKVTQWYPDAVRVLVYNERKGIKEEIVLPKKMVAIIENPFYAVMNEPSSTLQRLLRKLILKDLIDESTGANKLDMIVQLPYTIKTDTRMAEAEKRKKKIEEQLTDSKFGIAYIDATDKITQLNRPLENNLLDQIRDLTNQLYGQLGLTAEIINGTADEKAMLNYYNRTIEPVLAALCDEMRRKFLTKTGRTQGQSIMYFQDHFKLVPVNNIADIADKFTRNEIMTANEIRSVIGMMPSDDPKADELRNSNMPQPEGEAPPDEEVDPEELEEARDTLLKAGLTEDDLKELRDAEIVELAERYRNNDLEDEEEGQAPPGNSSPPDSG